MRTIVLAVVAGAGILLLPSLEASAAPANGAAIAHAAKQADTIINVRKRCPGGQRRDSHGYCIPSARGF